MNRWNNYKKEINKIIGGCYERGIEIDVDDLDSAMEIDTKTIIIGSSGLKNSNTASTVDINTKKLFPKIGSADCGCTFAEDMDDGINGGNVLSTDKSIDTDDSANNSNYDTNYSGEETCTQSDSSTETFDNGISDISDIITNETVDELNISNLII